MSCDVAMGAGCTVLFYVLIVMLQWMWGCTVLYVLTVMLQWMRGCTFLFLCPDRDVAVDEGLYISF